MKKFETIVYSTYCPLTLQFQYSYLLHFDPAVPIFAPAVYNSYILHFDPAVPILAPAGPPVNFSSVILQPHLVTFSWEPPLAELQNGPIIGYSIRCCAAESEYTVGNECVEELNITGGSIAMTQFIPGTAYNCSLVSYTRSGGSPSAVLTVETPKDGMHSTIVDSPAACMYTNTSNHSNIHSYYVELLFQIVLRGVSNCSQLAVSCIDYLYQIISACFSDL